MKPIKLKLKGINSFVNEQIVDFEKLTEPGIFGIVGDTGSGKSTIIDAMILALYGEVPRYAKKADRDFINSYVDEGFVSFLFSVSVNGKNEKFKIERNFKKKDEKIDEKISRFIKFNEDEEVIVTTKITEIRKNIEELLGLKYEDFTRAVILPQGKFSEFLTLENLDRRNMLERIFKLEKYGDKLNKKIKEQFNTVENELKILEANLEANSDVTDLRIKGLKNEKEEIILKLKKLQQDEKEFSNTVLAKKETIDVVNELENKSKEKELLLLNKENFNEKEKELNNSKKAEILIENIKELEKIEHSLITISENKKEIEKELEKNYILEEKAKINYEKILEYKNENYETLLENLNNAKQGIEVESQLNEKLKDLNKTREEYQVNKEGMKQAENQVEKLEKERVLLTENLEEKKLEKSKNKITQEFRNIILQGVEVEKELKNSIEEKNSLNKEIEVDLKNSKENKIKLDEKIQLEKELTRKFENFNVDAKVLNKLKESLKVGDICPVCGEEVKNILIANRELEEKVDENQIKLLRDEILALSVTLKTNYNKIENNEKQINLITEKELKTLQYLNELKKKEAVNDFQLKYKELEEKEVKYEFLEKEINKKEELLKTNIKELEVLKTELLIKEKSLESKLNQGKTLKALVDELRLRLKNLVGDKEPKVLYKELEKNKEEILLKESETKNNLEKIKNFVQTLKSKNQGLQGEFTSLLKISNESKKNLDDKMVSLNFQNITEVKNLYLGKNKQISLEEEIKKYNNELLLINTKVNELKDKVQGIDENKLKEDYKIACELLEKTVEDIDNMNKNLGSVKADLDRLESKIETVNKWNKEKRIFTKDMDNLVVLKKLFAGNSFIEFIGKRHLKYICAEGTRRLKLMSNNKYEISLKESDFFIKDNSRGGIIRSPKTLSGGEVFMVSLCLSLALSNQIQMKNSGSLDMFFLDEGFGTLDNNARDTVINSLINLIDDNKMKIGLITHVEEIKELLPSKLVVSIEDPVEGSVAVIKK